MKFLTRRKKKEKNDADLYQPPHIDSSSAQQQHQTTLTHNDDQRPQSPSSSTAQSSYRYALQAYASTISPSLSNADGFGGGGTLRSRSTKSGGKKHCTLIPVFPLPSSCSSSVEGGGVETMDRYSFSYDQIHERIEAESALKGEEDEERYNNWAPIPEEPRSPGDFVEEEEEYGVGQEQVIGQSSSEAHSSKQRARLSSSAQSSNHNLDVAVAASSSSSSINFQPSIHSTTPTSIHSQYTKIQQHSPEEIIRTSTKQPSQYTTAGNNKSTTSKNNNNNTPIILQPSAIYEEHYGDAYTNQHIKYLYPSGYQSMRPRSGPWKLSIFIFGLFMWLSVFIVGHCYDRGQEYNIYFGHADDAYLSEVDDDLLVMETRWCGSRVIYAMWFVCVSITMLSLSYCSIIGYIKLRDVAVANGRSQPTGVGSGRSDCYADIENVKRNMNFGNLENEDKRTASEAGSGSTATFASYQDGGVARRYPSIYQSDGTPQFWGGHIYRPMQAAVSMTNR